MESLKELESFRNREEALRKITRYSLEKVMFYRTNLWTHSRRTLWIAKILSESAKEFFPEFNIEKACLMAAVHDDAELIMGDVQAGNKEKMSQKELADLKAREENAIDEISKQFPEKAGGYVYRDLLREEHFKNSIEAKVVDWADKYDAFGEALHELYAGNLSWTMHVENEYGKISLPTEYYMKFFRGYLKKYPDIVKMSEGPSKLFKIPERIDEKEVAENGILHTKDSLNIQKGYYSYDFWISTTIENGTEEDIRNLYLRRE